MKSKRQPSNSEQPLKELERFMASPQAQKDKSLMAMWASYRRTHNRRLLKGIERRIRTLGVRLNPPGTIRSVEKNDPVTQGEIVIGHDMQSRNIVTCSLQDLSQQAVAPGATGSGKTTLVNSISQQCVDLGHGVIHFQKKDHQCEHHSGAFGRVYTFFNLHEIRWAFFDTANLGHRLTNYKRIIQYATDIFCREDSRAVGYKAVSRMHGEWSEDRIHREGFPTVIDLMKNIRKVRVEPSRKKLQDSIYGIFQWIWEKSMLYHARRGMYESLCENPTIIRYADGEDYEVFLFLLLFIERFVQDNEMLPEEKQRYLFVFFDDSQELVRQQFNRRLAPLVGKITTVRQNKLVLFLVFHTTKGVEPGILTTPGNYFVSFKRENREALELVSSLGLTPDHADFLAMLQPGQFLMRTPSSEGVVAVQACPFATPDKLEKHEWERQNEERKPIYRWTPLPPEEQDTDTTKQSPDGDQELPEHARKVLNYLSVTPFATGAEVRQSLKIAPKTFSAAVRHLEDRRLIVSHSICRYCAYELTAQGCQKAGCSPIRHNGGFKHAFAVHKIADYFENRNYNTALEESLPPAQHRIDLVARKKNHTVAVEYETGTSTILQNAYECCRTTADVVVVVLPDEKSKSKIQRRFNQDDHLVVYCQNSRLRVATLWQFLQNRDGEDEKEKPTE